MMKKVSLLLPLCLTACITVGPDYAGPPDAPGDAKHFARAAEGVQPGLVVQHWWAQLGDAELDHLVTLALRQSPNMQVAQARLHAARDQLAQQVSAGNPIISAMAGRTSLNYAPETESQAHYHFYSLSGIASWELDLFGGQRRAVEAASASRDAVAEDLVDVQISLVAEVTATYIQVRNQQAQEDSLRQLMDDAQQSLRLVRQQHASGTADSQAVDQRVSRVAALQATIEQIQAARLVAQDRLALLCGQEPASLDQALDAGAAKLPELPETVTVGDPTAMLQHRPDIRAAERRLAASNALIGVQKSNYFPKLSLMGGLSMYSATNGSELFNNEKNRLLWGMPYLTWDFLSFNRTLTAVTRAKAAHEEAVAAYRATVLQALNDANSALTRYGRQRRVLAQRSVQLESARHQLEIATAQHQAGVLSLIGLADAHSALVEAERNQRDARAQMLTDYVLLQKSLGAGWKAS